jgi:hypothetical protein
VIRGEAPRYRQARRSLRGLGGLAVLTASLAMAAGLAGCGTSGDGSAAAPQPPAIPGLDTAAPDLTGVNLPSFTMPLIKGGISRPNHSLTPGDVTTTDANAVCALSKHALHTSIPLATQTLVYNAYGYSNLVQQHKYIITYLVPQELGGAPDTANMWPAAIRGTGYYQEIATNSALRTLVCRREISLTDAQHLLETDWYSAWLRYVVAAGHA